MAKGGRYESAPRALKYLSPFGKDLFDKRGQKSIILLVVNKRLDKLRP
jgi:hypothetical protein